MRLLRQRRAGGHSTITERAVPEIAIIRARDSTVCKFPTLLSLIGSLPCRGRAACLHQREASMYQRPGGHPPDPSEVSRRG